MGIMYSLVRTRKDTYQNEQMQPMYVGVLSIKHYLYVSVLLLKTPLQPCFIDKGCELYYAWKCSRVITLSSDTGNTDFKFNSYCFSEWDVLCFNIWECWRLGLLIYD